VTSATETRSAGKIILNWLRKTGDRIRGILKKSVKRLLDQLLQLRVRTPDLDMVIFMVLILMQVKESQCEVVFTDPAVDTIEKRLDSGLRTEMITNTSRKDVPRPTVPTCDMQEQEPEVFLHLKQHQNLIFGLPKYNWSLKTWLILPTKHQFPEKFYRGSSYT
jgi:hypothetical protein